MTGYQSKKKTAQNKLVVTDLDGHVVRQARKKRTWVGLTDEQREKHRDDWHSNIHDKEFKAIEAKLKQNNGFSEENT